VPAFLVTPAVVPKQNVMKKVIKDGFQNLDTIQKSLPADKWPKWARNSDQGRALPPDGNVDLAS
jgi:hypothetical protein